MFTLDSIWSNKKHNQKQMESRYSSKTQNMLQRIGKKRGDRVKVFAS